MKKKRLVPQYTKILYIKITMEMVSSMQPMKILTTHFSSSCAPHFIILAVCVVVVVPIMTMSMLKCLVSPSSQRKPKKKTTSSPFYNNTKL